MATGKNSYSKDPHHGDLSVNWAEADWPVDVQVRPRRFAVELVQVQPRDARTRGRAAGGARPDLDAWFIWRTSQTRTPRRHAGFTLIEMLVVIAVIGILAGLLLPALIGVKIRTKVRVTKSEINNLAAAITAYEAEYSRPPLVKEALSAALSRPDAKERDFTYGGKLVNNTEFYSFAAPVNDLYKTNNAELIAILQRENQSSIDALQKRSVAYNPRQLQFFEKKRVDQTDIPGIGPDNIFRDAWGNPYIITIDANDDGIIHDPIYARVYPRATPQRPAGIRAPVAIWSAGPDMRVDVNIGPIAGVNKDNIVSWE